MKLDVIMPKVKIKLSKYTQVYTPCKDCSFSVVAQDLVKYYNKYIAKDDESKKLEVTYRPSPDVAIVISDMWSTFSYYYASLLPPDAVYWVDSAWLMSNIPPNKIVRDLTVVTTSAWNSQVMTMYGIPNYIVPRAVDDDVADSVFEKVKQNPTDYKYDFILVATVTKDGHKNEKLVYQVLSDLNALTRTLKICDREWCDIKAFTLSDEQIYDYMRQSKAIIWLSESEGFGLPPAEAMAVGTPAIRFDSIYVEAPFVGKGHEHILQFKVPVYGFKLRESAVAPGRYFPSPIFDYNDVIRAFREALYYFDGNDRDEIYEMRFMLHEYVKNNFYHSVVIDKLLRIDAVRVRLQ